MARTKITSRMVVEQPRLSDGCYGTGGAMDNQIGIGEESEDGRCISNAPHSNKVCLRHDDEGGGSNGGGGDGAGGNLPSRLSFSMHASKIACMLLHCNRSSRSGLEDDFRSVPGESEPPLSLPVTQTEKEEIFNPFFTLNVNARGELEVQRLLRHCTEKEKQNNMAYQLCQADIECNPLRGEFSACVVSFQENVDRNVTLNAPSALSPVHGEVRMGGQEVDAIPELYAVPVVSEIVKRALTWLSGADIEVSDVQNGLLMFKDALWNLFTNGTLEELLSFIARREWDVHHLWGGDSKEAFLSTIEDIQDDLQKWRQCRRFITFNMAWQTKLMLLPVDSLHRCVVSSSILNGIPPPGGANKELTKIVRDFWHMMIPGPLLCIEGKEGKHVDFETVIILQCFLPTEITQQFCSQMQNVSAKKQTSLSLQSEHTMCNMLNVFLQDMPEGKYLYDTGPERNRGVERILRGLHHEKGGTTREAFKEVLVSDNLCSEDVADQYADKIMTENKGTWPSNAKLADYYIGIWLNDFTTSLHKALVKFVKASRSVAGIDEAVNLPLVMNMSLVHFQRMFKTHTKNKYKDDDNMSSFRLDPDQPPKIPTLLAKFGTSGFLDLLGLGSESNTGQPYQKPCSDLADQNDGDNRCCPKNHFPSHYCEFSWIVMFAMLSQETEEAIKKYLSSNIEGKETARMHCRCLVLVISSAVQSSGNYWYPGFFTREIRGAESLHKMGCKSQMLYLLNSAIIHSCEGFAAMRQVPPLKMTEDRGLTEFTSDKFGLKKVLEDQVVLSVLTFLAQNYMDYLACEKTFRDICTKSKNSNRDNAGFKSWLQPRLNASVQCDCGSNKFTVINNQEERWLGDLSIGGEKSHGMTPDRLNLNDGTCSLRFAALVQVIGNGGDTGRVTHRFLQFIQLPIQQKLLMMLMKYAQEGGDKTSFPASLVCDDATGIGSNSDNGEGKQVPASALAPANETTTTTLTVGGPMAAGADVAIDAAAPAQAGASADDEGIVEGMEGNAVVEKGSQAEGKAGPKDSKEKKYNKKKKAIKVSNAALGKAFSKKLTQPVKEAMAGSQYLKDDVKDRACLGDLCIKEIVSKLKQNELENIAQGAIEVYVQGLIDKAGREEKREKEEEEERENQERGDNNHSDSNDDSTSEVSSDSGSTVPVVRAPGTIAEKPGKRKGAPFRDASSQGSKRAKRSMDATAGGQSNQTGAKDEFVGIAVADNDEFGELDEDMSLSDGGVTTLQHGLSYESCHEIYLAFADDQALAANEAQVEALTQYQNQGRNPFDDLD